MGVCDTLTDVECVIEQNNLITYKIAVLVILLLYSIWSLYKHDKDNFMKLKINKSYYDYYKELFSWLSSKLYLFSLPFLLILLRTTIDFELFITLVASIYAIFFIIFLGLILLFTEKFAVSIFTKSGLDNVRESFKYGKEKN